MTEHKVSGTINLAAMIGGLQRSLQHLMDLVSFGLISAEKAIKEDLLLPGANFHIATASNESLDFDIARQRFQTWALAGGLRDCVEAINAFLDEVHKVCSFYWLKGQSPVTGTLWNDKTIDEPRRFHRLGLPDKLPFLANNYDVSLIPEVTPQILSINQARNCLVHRKGVVSERDLNSSDGLLVQWTKLELSIEGPSGRRVVELPAQVERGEIVTGTYAETSKLFTLNQRVAFSAQEFSELCLTFFLFGQQLSQKLESYGRSMGIQFKDPVVSAPEQAL